MTNKVVNLFPIERAPELKQVAGSRNCLAVVGAMIARKTVEDFERVVGKHNYYYDHELYFYLANYNICLGQSYVVTNPKEGQFDFGDEVSVKLERDREYYLAVRSWTNPNWSHAIYWDGNKVLDPNPKVLNGITINNYEVLNIYPICRWDLSGVLKDPRV